MTAVEKLCFGFTAFEKAKQRGEQVFVRAQFKEIHTASAQVCADFLCLPFCSLPEAFAQARIACVDGQLAA